MTDTTESQGTPLGDRRYPGGHDARDLTLTEKAVAMHQLAEAGLLPKYQVVHHACSFDRCSCWCVYNPDKTLFAAIGPSEPDRAVANKLVDKMNRDLAQILARPVPPEAGQRQEAGGKGQEGDTVAQMHTGGTPVPPEYTHSHVSGAPAADSLRATNPGSAGVGGGTAAGAGAEGSDSDAVHRTVVKRTSTQAGRLCHQRPTEPARDVPVVRDVGPSSREREGAPEKMCGIPGCGIISPEPNYGPHSSVEPTLPAVIKALVPLLEEFFGDRSMAMAASGRSAVEIAAVFKEVGDRGIHLWPVRIERPIAGQLLVIVEGIDADGIERGHTLNLLSIPAVAKMVGDRLVSEIQVANKAVGA